MRFVFSIIKAIRSRICRVYEGYKYTSYTIAEKFREQGAKIGQNCAFQIRELAAEPYLVEIGNNVFINADVIFITHDGASVIFREEIPFVRYFGKIIIEDNCFVGFNATILPGVRIGANSIIGAGAVVMRDVKPGSVMVGNPALRISTTEKYKERCIDEWKKQGLTKFEPLFAGSNRRQIQKIMESKKFRKELKDHLLSNRQSKFLKARNVDDK